MIPRRSPTPSPFGVRERARVDLVEQRRHATTCAPPSHSLRSAHTAPTVHACTRFESVATSGAGVGRPRRARGSARSARRPRARPRARARPPRRARRRAARPSPATSRTARPSRGGRPAGRSCGWRSDSVRSPKSVSTSGCGQALGRAGDSAPRPTAASRAASPRRAPAGRRASSAIVSGVERRADARRERVARRRVCAASPDSRASAAQPGERRRLRVGVGDRRLGRPCRPRAGCRCRAPCEPSGSIVSRQPCWTRPPGARRCQRSRPPPRSSAPSSQSPGRAPGAARARRPARRRRSSPARAGTTTSRRPSRSSAARRRAPEPQVAPGARRQIPGRTSWTILPGSSSHVTSSRVPWMRGERAQRRGGDVGARGQHLQRRDQRVAPEERVEAARDRRRPATARTRTASRRGPGPRRGRARPARCWVA